MIKRYTVVVTENIKDGWTITSSDADFDTLKEAEQYVESILVNSYVNSVEIQENENI